MGVSNGEGFLWALRGLRWLSGVLTLMCWVFFLIAFLLEERWTDYLLPPVLITGVWIALCVAGRRRERRLGHA